jgi:type I restriction enzyme S subunit
MKKEMCERKLGDLVTIKTGKLDANAMVENGMYPFFTCAREIFTINDYAFDCEAVLLAGNNASGDFNVKYYQGKFNAYQRTYIITIIDTSIFTYRYLYILLINYLKTFKENSLGSNTKFLKIGIISEIKFLLPSLAQQQEITAFVDKTVAVIDKAKTKAEKNLKNAKELFEKYLNNTFDILENKWELKKISEVAQTGAGGTPLKSHKDYYENGNIPWLRSGEVCKKEITSCEIYITRKGLDNSSARFFPPDTVLVAMYGATAAQVGILKFEASTNQAVCGILPNKQSIPEYLYYCLLSKRDELVSQAVGGAQPNISQIKIKETQIPLPNLIEQKILTKRFNAMNNHCQNLQCIYQKKITALEELKKSILEKAFKGELTEKTKDLHLAAL